MKDVVEELGLAQANATDTPMPVSQPSKAAIHRISVREMQHCIGDWWRKVNDLAMDRPDIRHGRSEGQAINMWENSCP